MAESTLDGGDALIVGAGTDLTEESLLVVGFEPGSRCGETFGTDGG